MLIFVKYFWKFGKITCIAMLVAGMLSQLLPIWHGRIEHRVPPYSGQQLVWFCYWLMFRHKMFVHFRPLMPQSMDSHRHLLQFHQRFFYEWRTYLFHTLCRFYVCFKGFKLIKKNNETFWLDFLFLPQFKFELNEDWNRGIRTKIFRKNIERTE